MPKPKKSKPKVVPAAIAAARRRKHRLVAIGDSLTQGFKSGAICETELSYPAIIAWEMGLGEDDFRYPSFSAHGGLPINIEYLLRRLDERFGDDIDWTELPLAPFYLRSWLDEIEDYWERGPGAKPVPYRGAYHNLAVWGFEVQDAYLLTARMCADIAGDTSDDWLVPVPANAMYRTGVRVLNPTQREEEGGATQISRAMELGADGGIENLIVFLGANNALGAVTSLDIVASEEATLMEPDPRRRKPRPDAEPANLYAPDHFRQIFRRLVAEVGNIDAERVFWGTVPPVTIAPVTNGVGGRMETDMGLPSPYGDGDDPKWFRRYFRYYTRPWVPDDKFRPNEDPYLSGIEAMTIDLYIAMYKEIVVEEVERHNAARRAAGKGDDWFVVDIRWALERIAYRRYQEEPGVPPPPGWSAYEMPASYRKLGLDTRFLRAEQGVRVAGGIFSLDGVHATTAAYGLVAQEFINIMQHAGVEFRWGDRVTPRAGQIRVDYDRLIRLDTLLKGLPRTLDDLFEKVVDGDQVLDIFKRALRVIA